MRRCFPLVLACAALTLLATTVGGLVPAPALAEDVARIDSPANGASIVGQVEVRGRAMTADPSRFSFYRLHYGTGSSPSSLRPIGSPGDQPVESGVLGVWDTTPLVAGEYLLQLTVYDVAGQTTTAHVVVNVLPAPTPTPRPNVPSVLVPTLEPTPAPADEGGPTPTPIPELPQLDPQIPQIDIPPSEGAAPVPVAPVPEGQPGFQPIPIEPGAAPTPPPPIGAPPAESAPIAPIDTGPSGGPTAPINPISPVGPPPAPAIPPYEPPPPPTPPPLPTPEGLSPPYGLPFQP